MHKIIRHLALSMAALGLFSAVHAADTYTIDNVHSSVGFSIRHLVSKVPGTFTTFSGTIVVDQEDMTKNTVEAVIDVGSVNTANEKRDNHLKTPDFFDAAQFATISFKSKAWKKTGEDTYDVTGDLTMKGVTKEVVLNVTVLGFGPGMKPGTKLSGWEATTTLNKSDFNLAGPAMLGKVLGDEVKVHITIEAVSK